MPPRLSHKKTRSGCQRCKARKVKCDEARPRCTACARHNVLCEYPNQPMTMLEQLALPSPPEESSGHVTGSTEPDEVLDHRMELVLMHEWTAYASKTFSTAWEYWCYQAPLIALDHRYAMDGLLGLAALHSAKRHPSQWSVADGRLLATRDPLYTTQNNRQGLEETWKIGPAAIDNSHDETLSPIADHAHVAAKRCLEMTLVSRQYFDRAIDGHRKALANITVENIDSVHMTAVLVAFNALSMLGEGEKYSILPAVDPTLWLQLASGSAIICDRWRQLSGDAWVAASSTFYGKPDLSNNEELFNPKHAKPFEKLLTYGGWQERLNEEDQETYSRALSYIGLIYTGIQTKSDHPVATCRRLMAMPARLPLRFTAMAQQGQPRAMAMLAHVFACMKLLDDKVLWFKDVAECQIPNIYRDLPEGWRPMLEWPMAVARGEPSAIGRGVDVGANPSFAAQ